MNFPLFHVAAPLNLQNKRKFFLKELYAYLLHIKTLGKHLYRNTLMNSAEHFKNQQPSTFSEIF